MNYNIFFQQLNAFLFAILLIILVLFILFILKGGENRLFLEFLKSQAAKRNGKVITPIFGYPKLEFSIESISVIVTKEFIVTVGFIGFGQVGPRELLNHYANVLCCHLPMLPDNYNLEIFPSSYFDETKNLSDLTLNSAFYEKFTVRTNNNMITDKFLSSEIQKNLISFYSHYPKISVGSKDFYLSVRRQRKNVRSRMGEEIFADEHSFDKWLEGSLQLLRQLKQVI